jgi:transcriptional regulator with XRE-family HTH domain
LDPEPELGPQRSAAAEADRTAGVAQQAVLSAMGIAIRELRLSAFMTQEQLAARSGVDQSVISRLERGRPVGLRWQRLVAVLGALGVVRMEFEHNMVRQGGLGPSSVEELWSLSRRRSA